MLQPPRNATFETEKMNKKLFLNGVLGRLKNDAGNYLDFVEKHNSSTGEGIGFWGSIRLLMPVIEAIANVYPQYQSKTADFLRNELGVKTPNLIWILYRHSLMHNDLLQHGRFNGVDATWGVSMFGQNHIIQDEVVGLDTLKLYNDLTAFLKKEIENCNENDEVEIIRGVVWSSPNQEIQDEFKLIAPK